MNTFLCIGGPLAGQRYASKYMSFNIAVRPKMSLSGFQSNSVMEKINSKTVTYVRDSIYTPAGPNYFWIPEGQSPEDTLSMLFQAYADHNL